MYIEINYRDIFYKNPDNLPNLYVKMYLLPEREKTSKRKTKVSKHDQFKSL